jgi:hypothetical protein
MRGLHACASETARPAKSPDWIHKCHHQPARRELPALKESSPTGHSFSSLNCALLIRHGRPLTTVRPFTSCTICSKAQPPSTHAKIVAPLLSRSADLDSTSPASSPDSQASPVANHAPMSFTDNAKQRIRIIEHQAQAKNPRNLPSLIIMHHSSLVDAILFLRATLEAVPFPRWFLAAIQKVT